MQLYEVTLSDTKTGRSFTVIVRAISASDAQKTGDVMFPSARAYMVKLIN